MTVAFPGESQEYREARNRLLTEEAGLRRTLERVAEARRALPPGGVVPEDYVFADVEHGDVRLSDLFAPGKDTLVIYSFMFPRHPSDDRPGPDIGATSELPLAETPCASCTSILDSLDGAAPHLAPRINLAVVAKSPPDRIRAFAEERRWRHLRLLSSAENDFNRDYLAETEDGMQLPILNVFRRDGDEIRHFWGSELMYGEAEPGQEPRALDLLWPLWNVLDATPDGRGTDSDFPRLSYG
ncbi:MAG: DUF899 family protein [Solirubrobacterales bacterium]